MNRIVLSISILILSTLATSGRSYAERFIDAEEQKVKSEYDAQKKDHLKDSTKGGRSPRSFLAPTAIEITPNTNFPPPKPYTLEDLHIQIKKDCLSKGSDCYKARLIEITKQHGAKSALNLLKRLITNGEEWGATHHIAHHIGFYNVITFGASRETFVLCTEDFRYGCVHGFFQGAARTKQMDPHTIKKFADDLANDPSIAPGLKNPLYHGLGHWYMVYGDYDLHKAIEQCDQLNAYDQKRDCWGGLFMENEDCSLMDNWQKCGYSKEDPTTPCSRLPSIYQETCYFNHSRWLMALFDNDFAKVIEVCKNIAEGKGKGCLEILTSRITNLRWQKNFIEDYSSRSIQKTAAFVCRQFPDNQMNVCIQNTVINFKKWKKTRKMNLEEFCQGLDPQYYQLCLSHINK